MTAFGGNVGFLRFLSLARKDGRFRKALERSDAAAVDAFPGLSPEERVFLKAADWSRIPPAQATFGGAGSLRPQFCELSQLAELSLLTEGA